MSIKTSDKLVIDANWSPGNWTNTLKRIDNNMIIKYNLEKKLNKHNNVKRMIIK